MFSALCARLPSDIRQCRQPLTSHPERLRHRVGSQKGKTIGRSWNFWRTSFKLHRDAFLCDFLLITSRSSSSRRPSLRKNVSFGRRLCFQANQDGPHSGTCDFPQARISLLHSYVHIEHGIGIHSYARSHCITRHQLRSERWSLSFCHCRPSVASRTGVSFSFRGAGLRKPVMLRPRCDCRKDSAES